MPRSRAIISAVCLWGLSLVAACGDDPPRPTEPAAARVSSQVLATPTPPTVATGRLVSPPRLATQRPGGGLRVDLTGAAPHVRALERQPDGTYKNVCVDAPGALRPAPRGHGDDGDGSAGSGGGGAP
jgi:hypothetical protein